MHSAFTVPFSILALAAAGTSATGVWTTPHDSYSSSVGVLGCKINTDRVAYWPGSVDCNNICVKLSYQGRSVHLLRVDQSGGAYDISYDAWNYLQTGKSAAADPISGGTVAMEYEEVDASECADLIHTPGSKLPLSASNSINFLVSCLAQPSSWVAKNYVLYNICDPICSVGFDEECTLDLATSNQPTCAHTLGLTSPLTSAPVYNIQYQTGDIVVAGSGVAAPASVKATIVSTDQGSSSSSSSSGSSSSSSSGQDTPAPAAASSPSVASSAAAAAQPQVQAPTTTTVKAAAPSPTAGGVFVEQPTTTSTSTPPAATTSDGAAPAAQTSTSQEAQTVHTTLSTTVKVASSSSSSAAADSSTATATATAAAGKSTTATTFTMVVSGTGGSTQTRTAAASSGTSTQVPVQVNAAGSRIPSISLAVVSSILLASILGFY
ncbi:hypothetical protein QBC46DRAFT_389630 [Diplogelasinospora grovesii]|uniref:Uncharacterized protein n=1 Tax=Diplogelasinospora grovesii TaxID=303347 RepID=A0AAN6N7D2_9PEZI|nr:hypothetical protein QBC46DRAFT_389630 [Diplogelasinospora grovesii]